MKIKFIVFILILIFGLQFVSRAEAATIFEDNFEIYSENTFPTKWVTHHSPFDAPQCNAIPKVENGKLVMRLNQSGCTMHMIPAMSEWPTMLDEYVFEGDVRFINGIDRHFLYRVNPSTFQMNVVHFFSPGDFGVDTDNPHYEVFVGKSYVYGHTYHFKMVVTNNELKVYAGEPGGELELVRHVIHLTPRQPGTIGIGSSPGSGSVTETWYDNVKVTTLENEEEEEEGEIALIKQTDPQWSENLYDSAHLWSTESQSIGRWGCAMTSAAMVFRYNNITTLPNGQDLNPGTLNEWLKAAPDGYIRNGLVNWLALSRMSRLASVNNPAFLFDVLEYERHGRDDEKLTTYINNKIFPILQVPGHFVAASGIDTANQTFLINDPFYDRASLANEYNKEYLSMGTFTPANSDLSYIMLVVDPSVVISMTDLNGNLVGESFIQDPIQDPLGLALNSKGPVKIYYFRKPSTGKYTLKLSSATKQAYTLDKYMYDVNGNLGNSTVTGSLSNTVDTFVINFNKEDSLETSLVKIDFEYVIKELKAACQQKKFKNIAVCASLLAQIEAARLPKNKIASKSILNAMILLLDKEKKFIDPTAARLLIADLQALKNSL